MGGDVSTVLRVTFAFVLATPGDFSFPFFSLCSGLTLGTVARYCVSGS